MRTATMQWRMMLACAVVAVLAISSASPAATVINDGFDDMDWSQSDDPVTDPAWTRGQGGLCADGTATDELTGTPLGNFQPTDEGPYEGWLAMGTGNDDYVYLDYSSQYSNAGLDPSKPTVLTIEFDLKQTNDSPINMMQLYLADAADPFVNYYMFEFSGSDSRYGVIGGGTCGFASWDGNGNIVARFPDVKLEVADDPVHLKVVFDPTKTHIELYQNDELVAYGPNYLDLDKIDRIELWNADGVLSWFIDNVVIEATQPYMLYEDFEDLDYNGWTIESGYWSVLGDDEFDGTDPLAAWGAKVGEMASSDPNAIFSRSIQASASYEIVHVGFEIQQPNGTTAGFQAGAGLREAGGDDYVLGIATPNPTEFGGSSGAVIMMQDEPVGNGWDNWWSYGPGEDAVSYSWDPGYEDRWRNACELVFHPFDGVSFYIDGILAAQYPNFRNIESVDEVFFFNYSGTCTWNFDNITVWYEQMECGDRGLLAADLNEDCYVEWADFGTFAGQWQQCTDPNGQGCTSDGPTWPIIEQGTATVDGDLGDWAGADWIALDTDYLGSGYPADLTGAQWAAKWDDTSNLLYVAITADDTYHWFTDGYADWNTQDCVEVYVDAANSDTAGYNSNFQDAQQWVLGPDSADTDASATWGGGAWLSLGANMSYDTVNTNVAYAVNVSGDTIVYEMSVAPYELYTKDDATVSTIRDLETGDIIGLDVIMDTITDSQLTFSMASANDMGSKFQNAGQFATYQLGDLQCGDWGYLVADLNQDCSVEWADFGTFASQWQQCTDPQNASCWE